MAVWDEEIRIAKLKGAVGSLDVGPAAQFE
jgi:hypothetical protein